MVRWRRLFLAIRAIDGAAAVNHHVLQRALAARAGFAAFAVGGKCLREVAVGAVGVGEIAQRGAALFDGSAQHAFDGIREAATVGAAEAVGGTGGVYAARKQRFGGVDVADADQVALVHDVGFDGGGFAAGLCVEAVAVEGVVQRFVAQCGQARRWPGGVNQGDVAEAARVVQAQFVAVIKGDGDVVVFFARAVGGDDAQRAAHAKVDMQREFGLVGVQDEVFAAPLDAGDGVAAEAVECGDVERLS